MYSINYTSFCLSEIRTLIFANPALLYIHRGAESNITDIDILLATMVPPHMAYGIKHSNTSISPSTSQGSSCFSHDKETEISNHRDIESIASPISQSSHDTF